MVNYLPVVSQEQQSSFRMFTPLFIGSQDEIMMVLESNWAGKVYEETLEEEKRGSHSRMWT